MSLRKYQAVDNVQVLPKDEQEKIAANIHKLGKTSAVELTEEERAKALDTRATS